jgi:hypothetical protein
MADDTADQPPEHWRTITPEASWRELSSTRAKLAAERASAQQAVARVAELEGLINQVEPKLQRVADLEATTARLQSRLSMSRLGIVDDEVAEIAEQRFSRYQTTAGKDAKALDAWLAEEARADRILSPLLAPAASSSATPAAPLPPVPVVPAPTAPQRTSGTTADEIARIRAANNGRIPKEVQKDLGTRISLGDLLGARR